MKKRQNISLSLLLVVLSIMLYTLQVLIFRSLRDTEFYLLQDLAFLPLQVAIVTIVLGRVINAWNKRERLKKINMAVSAFFSEAGTEIIVKMSALAADIDGLRPSLRVAAGWTGTDFSKAMKVIKGADLSILCAPEEFEMLKVLLLKKRDFMLRMLENPNLLEHDTFTDMLLAVFHVTEEMIARDDFACLPGADTAHLNIDIKRALQTLLTVWLNHMEHLSTDYPYLYSLEVRRNPFGDGNSVIIL
jgi:hypothetical protein